ncbi:MAG: 2-oxoacid:acceptor oxidoreductase family protein [Candidatus Methylomirabilales bacterium]
MRYEIRISGEGGQGVMLAGIILAEAAIQDGRNVVQTQAYGPESRGGATKAEVIISDEEIDYPKAGRIDLLLALTQEACDKYWSDLKETGTLIADSSRVLTLPANGFSVFPLPILDTAKDKVGMGVVANIVALGAVAGLSGVVSRGAVEKAVLARVPKGTAEQNLKALRAGFELAQASDRRPQTADRRRLD